MSEWLVVAGISVWVMATVGLLRQALLRGHSTVLFLLPLAGLRQVRENWSVYGALALLRVLGMMLLITGLALIHADYSRMVPVDDDRGQVLRGVKGTAATAFVRSPEAALLMVRGEGRPISGVVHGRSLETARVSLINGVLNIHQGNGFLPDLSVSLLLDWDPEDIQGRRTLLVDPTEDGGPPVHVSWRPEGQSYPETRIFREGYRLELALAPLDQRQFSGAVQLVLPDTAQSYLVGDFTAHTNHLRYRDGKVDLFFDHPDTLAHVTEDYLPTQFADGAIRRIIVENVNLRRSAREGEVQARVVLKDGSEERRRVQLEESAVGWAVTPGSMKSEVLHRAGEDDTPVAASSPGEQERVHAYQGQVEITDLSELAPYIGQPVTVRGQTRESEGVLTRVEPGRIWLEYSLGAGRAETSRARARIRHVTLQDGTRLTLSDNDDGRTP